MFTVSPATIKYADKLAVEKYGIPELTLMKNAAKSCVDYMICDLKHDSKIAVLCGKGNNGGDGYEIARILHKEWFDVTVINVFDCVPNTETASTVYNDCLDSGVKVLSMSEWKTALEDTTVILDAIFGVGFYGSIDGGSDIGQLLSYCNASNAKKIAIDVPSGINSLDGRVQGIVFHADMTFTMAYIKTGMLSYPAREFCGEIKICTIGYPDALCHEIQEDALIADDEYIKSIIPKRQSNTHKGSFGRLLMFCGCPVMTGAAVLSATAALRSGVGLVNIARDIDTIRVLQAHLTESVFSIIDENTNDEEISRLCSKASSILIGCGMGQAEADKNMLFKLIKYAHCPLIIDADGINAVCENKMVLKEANCTPILTPHPMEFSRLTGIEVSEIQANRLTLAKEFAKEYSCVTVLKGAATVIACPDGRIAVNTSGNSGLAKGGSGDVLAGLIASLSAQGLDAFNAAVCACYLHGKAADILKNDISEYGLLPSDLPMAIAKLLP